MKKKILSILIALVLLIISSYLIIAKVSDNEIISYIKSKIQTSFEETIPNPILQKSWKIKYLQLDNSIETNITPINSTSLEISFIIKDKTKKYNSVICDLLNISDFTLDEKINKDYISISKLNKEILKNKTLPDDWCKETKGEGYIIIKDENKDKIYRINMPDGDKKFLLISGNSTEIVDIEYSSIEIRGGVKIITFIDENSGIKTKDQISMVEYNG